MKNSSTLCKNCEQDFEGNFCNNCGQSARVKKNDIKYLLDEVPNSIFQINHGFVFTVKEIFTRPGYSIRDYIEGKKKLFQTFGIYSTHIGNVCLYDLFDGRGYFHS